jgi:hypothetical protein
MKFTQIGDLPKNTLGIQQFGHHFAFLAAGSSLKKRGRQGAILRGPLRIIY